MVVPKVEFGILWGEAAHVLQETASGLAPWRRGDAKSIKAKA
jgi:hypothetical protein